MMSLSKGSGLFSSPTPATAAADVAAPLAHSTVVNSTPENRQRILLRLNTAARSCMPYAHQLPAGRRGLNEAVPEALELCSLVEICLLNGIRIKEFHNEVPFWGLLERMETLHASPSGSTTTSRSSAVEFVSSLAKLRTPIARARGWIRHVLNLRVADEAVQALLGEPRLLSLYYKDASILRSADNATVLLGVLRSLKVLPLAYTADDAALNTAPAWLLAMITAAAVGEGSGGGVLSPAQVPRSVPYSPSSSSNSSSSNSSSNSVTPSRGGVFSSFLNTLGRGLTGVIESMDAFANKVATPLPLAAPSVPSL